MIKFAHLADTHLGFQQYGSSERYNDFYKAWLWCCEKIIEEEVDFVIHSGDLFHHRLVDPYTLSQAADGLMFLKNANIPVFIIEGNHEQARTEDEISWLYYLQYENYLEIIDSRKAMKEFKGIQIYGLPWCGAATVTELKKIKRINNKFSILMLHAGIDKFINRKHPATIPYNELPGMDYIATGHIHKPYSDGLVFNPGSTEANSVEEIQWQDRGFYITTVEQSDAHIVVNTEKVINPQRKFYNIKVSELKGEEDQCAVWHIFMDDQYPKEKILEYLVAPIVVKFKYPKPEKTEIKLTDEQSTIKSLDCDTELLLKLKQAALEEKPEKDVFNLCLNNL